MNKKTALWSPLLGVALLLVFSGSLAAAALKVGYQAGNLKFGQVISEADQKYLGLKNSGPFTLKDIQAEYVLIEVLNANCPHCMEQAAALNGLYGLVEGSDLKDRLKFIGVVSNSEAAVTKWRAAYKVPFALVPDPEWEIAGDFNITPALRRR
ncbi:MAG: peroxiredoxin family protein [Desulfobaccales bacterium]